MKATWYTKLTSNLREGERDFPRVLRWRREERGGDWLDGLMDRVFSRKFTTSRFGESVACFLATPTSSKRGQMGSGLSRMPFWGLRGGLL
jgi:hypothetical protein